MRYVILSQHTPVTAVHTLGGVAQAATGRAGGAPGSGCERQQLLLAVDRLCFYRVVGTRHDSHSPDLRRPSTTQDGYLATTSELSKVGGVA